MKTGKIVTIIVIKSTAIRIRTTMIALVVSGKLLLYVSRLSSSKQWGDGNHIHIKDNDRDGSDE